MHGAITRSKNLRGSPGKLFQARVPWCDRQVATKYLFAALRTTRTASGTGCGVLLVVGIVTLADFARHSAHHDTQ